MIVAAAQTVPHQQDIVKNLADHCRLTVLAAQHGAQLLAFPELSLTGYERERARQLAFTPDDPRLDKLRGLAAMHNMIIIAGAPVQMNSLLYIGAFIFMPDMSMGIYTKQYLHTGEEICYASSFAYNPMLQLEDETITLAICADITNPRHARDAAKRNSTIYLPMIFYSPAGIGQAHTLLSDYAKKYHMAVLMSNYGGPTWDNRASGGQSAVWNNRGELLATLGSGGEGLIIAEKVHNSWTGRIVKTV
ncbi:MAG TPA: carbon-nitrogen hydrolase family protein [bacterium]|nr:carbon-nitrogen hydrolase family protein [bacterium]HPN42185.1 carbon-nitrogen hydrolase family protein [bacterium]